MSDENEILSAIAGHILPDIQLGGLTEIADGGASLTVTVIVKGVVITGLMVGESAYYRKVADTVESSRTNDPESVASLGRALKAWAAELDTDRLLEQDDADQPYFLHLTEVKVGDSNPTTLPALRVRLASIDAWALGEARQS